MIKVTSKSRRIIFHGKIVTKHCNGRLPVLEAQQRDLLVLRWAFGTCRPRCRFF